MSGFSLSANEKIITRYPWYSLGYLDIYEYICNEDKESSDIYLHRAALRVYSREKLYKIFNSVAENEISDIVPQIEVEPKVLSEITPEVVSEKQHEIITEEVVETTSKVSREISHEVVSHVVPENDNEEEIILDEIIDFTPDSMPRFVLAGGDYFSRKDFDQVELDRSQPLDNFIAQKPTLLRSIVRGKNVESVPINEIDTSELFNDASFYTETLASIYTEQGFHKRALDVYAKLILLYPEKSSYFATLVKALKEKHKI